MLPKEPRFLKFICICFLGFAQCILRNKRIKGLIVLPEIKGRKYKMKNERTTNVRVPRLSFSAAVFHIDFFSVFGYHFSAEGNLNPIPLWFLNIVFMFETNSNLNRQNLITFTHLFELKHNIIFDVQKDIYCQKLASKKKLCRFWDNSF